MALVTDTSDDGRRIRLSDASLADAAVTVVVGPPAGQEWEFDYATVHYDGVPVQGGVTAILNSGKGAAYDTELKKGVANAQDSALYPDGKTILFPDDTLDILAPAGGGVLISGVSVYMKKVG